MASRAKARPLPKFGEWDVKNPSSAEGYTVIFNKARAEKKTTNVTTGNLVSAQRTETPYVNENEKKEKRKRPSKRKWFCFC